MSLNYLRLYVLCNNFYHLTSPDNCNNILFMRTAERCYISVCLNTVCSQAAWWYVWSGTTVI